MNSWNSKIDLESILQEALPIRLELGCGERKPAGRIGIDRLNLPEVDIVADLEEGLPFFPDNSVDEIHSKSFMEHVQHLDLLMHEIWRVLKPTGKTCIFVPHFSNPYFYSDYTHNRFFGLYSFEYFSKTQSRFRRKVPSFYHPFSFTTLSIRLNFSSSWVGRKLIKRSAEKIFNLGPWTQEFYEENFCYLIPCYGITAVLQPDK